MTTASHRRSLQPIPSLNRRSESDGIAPSSSTPSSIIAWAWYVDGVRKPAENLSVAAHLANAGEGFVWLGLKDPQDGDLMALASEFDLHRVIRRGALLDLAGRPGPSIGGRQRGHAQDLGVGGDRWSADDGGRYLR